MILQALHRLADAENLTGDPDFEFKPVAWIVTIDSGGRMVGRPRSTLSTPARPDNARFKPKPVAKKFAIPRQRDRTSGAVAQFLCDKAEYVFGVDPTPPDKPRRSDLDLVQRAALFREAVGQCLDATSDDGIRALHRFLDSVANGSQKIDLDPDTKPNDLFLFVYEPDVEQPIHERPSVVAHWKRLRGGGDNVEGEQSCLVSGKRFHKQGLFPSVKRVPGGQSKGASLVSFNAGAFESYGWSGNENAPISRDAAEACSTALHRLLDASPVDGQGERLQTRHVRVSADTIVGYWTSDKESDLVDGLASLFLNPDPDSVKDLYRSIWKGIPPVIDDPADFYALTLSGAQGRIIVRDWFETSVAQVFANLARHFADLDIVRNTPPPKGKTHPPVIALDTLMEAIAPPARRRDEAVPPHIAARFMRSALSGQPYPDALMHWAVQRLRAEIGNTDYANKLRNDARVAIIKAVLNRRNRRLSNQHYQEIETNMNPNHKSTGYNLGALLAVFERLQTEAIPSVNASVVDRYYAAASASPRTVFIRLYKGAKNHMRKLKDHVGMAVWLDRLVLALSARIGVRFDPKVYPARMDNIPAHLNLEEQALFHLGYHHMKHWMWMNKADRAEWQALHPDALGAFVVPDKDVSKEVESVSM